MNVVERMVFMSLSVGLFITAITVAISLYSQSQAALATVDEAITIRDRDLIMSPALVGDEVVYGTTVLQSIFQIAEIDADIIVDGYLFQKDADIHEANVGMISMEADYGIEYFRNNQGKLERVVFRKR
ncbi:hypothetical protein [Paenibacillus massiliensis]|uniref:hypothetical protein n=1 Tax=Paenibacillus massiliensis TaxID=225917 RepID=UPI000490B2FD|nr:hypothetical protein [Paenibacillus massiliensis]